MPEICRFFGIVIAMCFNDADSGARKTGVPPKGRL